MPGHKGNLILTLTDDELAFITLSVGFMNHQLGDNDGSKLKKKERSNLETYLRTRKEVREKIY